MRRLIIRPGAIGDFIVSLPALEFLKTDHTEVWTTAVNAPLVRFADCVDSIYATGIDRLPPGIERLSGFDSIISWYGANRPEFRDAVKHLPFEFHTALPQGDLHAVDYYLQQVGAPLGGTPGLPVARQPKDFVVIHPYSGSRKKNWPLDRFRELARRMDKPVRWVAGPEEELEEATRFDNLWDLAKWLATASLYIGNDSGIGHLAAAVGTPLIALFGPTDPRVWSPRGANVRIVAARDSRMESISIEEVESAVTSLQITF